MIICLCIQVHERSMEGEFVGKPTMVLQWWGVVDYKPWRLTGIGNANSLYSKKQSSTITP